MLLRVVMFGAVHVLLLAFACSLVYVATKHLVGTWMWCDVITAQGKGEGARVCSSDCRPHDRLALASVAVTVSNSHRLLCSLPWPCCRCYSFYSFDVGPAHVVALNPYTASGHNSKQYEWLLKVRQQRFS